MADHVLVSLGARGALLVDADGARHFAAVEVPGSGVGAGDAMLAGLAVGIARDRPLDEAVRLGDRRRRRATADPGSAPCTREDTERLFGQTVAPIDIPARMASLALTVERRRPWGHGGTAMTVPPGRSPPRRSSSVSTDPAPPGAPRCGRSTRPSGGNFRCAWSP